MNKNQKLIDLLFKIEANSPFATSKSTPEDLIRTINRAESLELIYQRIPGTYNYWLTKDGQKIIDNDGDLSVLENKSSISVIADNAHIGDNFGNYSQNTGKRKKTISEVLTVKNFMVAIIAGIVVWLITEFLLPPIF